MRVFINKVPKLCSVPVGSVVRLRDDLLTEPKEEDPVYLVCAFNVPGRRPARELMTHGLYDEERPLFLVDLRTGTAIAMPNLSSRVQVLKDASITLTEEVW
jgi:hypothetical protein